MSNQWLQTESTFCWIIHHDCISCTKKCWFLQRWDMQFNPESFKVVWDMYNYHVHHQHHHHQCVFSMCWFQRRLKMFDIIPFNVTWLKRHLFTSSFCYNPCLVSRRVVICLHRFIVLLLRYKGKNKSIPHYSARVRRTTFWKGMGNTMHSYNTAHINIPYFLK